MIASCSLLALLVHKQCAKDFFYHVTFWLTDGHDCAGACEYFTHYLCEGELFNIIALLSLCVKMIIEKAVNK